MSQSDPSCPQCRQPMERGFRLDRGHMNFHSAGGWVAGEPVRSMWSGLKLKNREMREVVSFRCPGCGMLLDFASGPRERAR